METGHPISEMLSTVGGAEVWGGYCSHSTRVCLICSHRLIAAALRDHLAHHGMKVFQSFENEPDLLPGLSGHAERSFDVVVLALVGPASSALGQIRETVEQVGGAPLVVLAEQVNRGDVFSALRAGAKALVSLDTEPEDLRRAIDMASRNKIYLSADVAELVVGDIAHLGGAESVGPRNMNFSNREAEIIRLLWDGLSTKEIGQRLHVSFKTVENHRYNIYQKCGASNLASLFRYAVRNAIVAV